MAQVALLITDSFGISPNTGLSRLQRASKWDMITLRVIGYHPESVVQLKSLIDQTNSERPVAEQYNDDACRIKFLSLIDTPTALADKAVAEMQAGTYRVGGVPDYGATVNGFDELWRTYFTRGDIKPRPGIDQGPRLQTNRVDGSKLSLDMNQLEIDDSGTVWYDGEQVANAHMMSSSGQRVLICWKCCDIGHTKNEGKTKRKYSVEEAIRILQGNEANDPSPRTRFFTRRGGRAAGGRGSVALGYRGRGKGGGSPNTFTVECDEQGNIFDPTTGDTLGHIAESDALEPKEIRKDTPTDPAGSDSTPTSESLVVVGTSPNDSMPSENDNGERALATATVFSCDNFLDALNTENEEDKHQSANDGEVDERHKMRYGLTMLCGGLLSVLTAFAAVTGRIHRNVTQLPSLYGLDHYQSSSFTSSAMVLRCQLLH